MSADYQKGYAAGRRREQRSRSTELGKWRTEQFKQSVFLAILPELVRAPWRTGEKRWNTITEFVNGAWNFADKAVARTWFSTETFAATEEKTNGDRA